MKKSLLLNLTYEPLVFISPYRAICLLLKGRAEIVTNSNGHKSIWDEIISTPTINFEYPATIKLKSYVNVRYKTPKFRKTVVLNRDRWLCQYCGITLSKSSATIDHIIPVSKGGLSSWQNCVASCKSCNKIKANKLLNEIQFKLLSTPKDPLGVHCLEKVTFWHKDWDNYLNFRH